MRNTHQQRERSPFFQCYADDWLVGTRDLPDDQCRLLMDFMNLFWSLKGQVTHDKFATYMRWDVRKFRRCLKALIDAGKIDLLSDGRLTNGKMEGQISALKARREAHTDKCGVGGTSPELSPNLQAKSDVKLPEKSTKSTIEPRKLKDPYPYREEREERKIDFSPPANSVVVAAREENAGGLEGLNGATTEILETVAAWVNPLLPDRSTATRFVGTLVASHGSAAVKTGFAALAAKLASGDLVARPLPLMAKMVADAANRPDGVSRPANGRGRGSEIAARVIAENRARTEAAPERLQ